MTVQHVTRMADEGMTLLAIRRVLEPEHEVAGLREQPAAACARLEQREHDS